MKFAGTCATSLPIDEDDYRQDGVADGQGSGLFLSIVIWGAILGGLILISRYNYLLFHSFAEIISVAVSTAVFLLAWNARNFARNSALVVLGIGYLCVGTIDLLHLLAYRGMGIFLASPGADLSIQLGLAGRMLNGCSLVAFSLALGRRWPLRMVLTGYVLVTGLLLASILWWQNFPSCYIEGQGLTFFKKTAEYLVCILLLFAFLLLNRRRARLDITVYQLISAAIALTLSVEIFLTLYVDVFGLSNLISHCLKIISFFFIYIALIRSSLTRPYTVLFREMQQITEELRNSEERFRHISLITSDVAYSCLAGPGQDPSIVWLSGAVERIFGYSIDEMKSMGCWRCRVYEEDLPLFAASITGLNPGASGSCELRLRHKNGQIVWVASYADCAENSGQHKQIFGGLVDITARKKVGELLSQQVDFKERIFNSTDSHLAILDDQGRILEVNAAWTLFAHNNGGDDRTCGPGAEYFRTCSLSAGCTEAAEGAYQGIRQVQQGVLPRFDIEYPCDSPTEKRWYFMRVLPLQGRPGMVLISHENITKRKQAEEENIKLENQLQQAQKMEAIGQLAGGVAHDFNNMLGVILGHTEMAMEAMGPSQPLFADLQEIRKAAQRSAAITRQLLAFARKQTVVLKILNLNETIEGMLNMLRRLIGENINLVWMPGTGLWPVKIDPSQVDQILANLCINARSAITGVGKITVATENSTLDEDYSASHMPTLPGEYLRLTVSDSGCGMDTLTLAHIFEPFFTTKEIGEGTGLGLATVFGVVKQNNGIISVDSEPGKGATFTIYLPRHLGEGGPAPVIHVEKPTRIGKETLLLVEDEPAILKMTTTMLQLLGYRVLAAKTPGEAERLARDFTGTIDMLITDVIMPEMDGRTLAARLLAIKPRLKGLFMSGYTAKIISQHGVLDQGVYFIEKPFTKKELAAKIGEVLGNEDGKA